MTRCIKALVVLAALASGVAPSPAPAQQTGQITGVVRAEATQRPLVGAQVFVSGTQIGALTNAEGRYLIIGVPVGPQEVRVTLIGYSQGLVQVVVEPGQATVADFIVAESAIELEEIVVTGTAAEVRAREVGNALDAVTARELEATPLTSPETMLAGRIPGLTVLQSAGQVGGGTQVRIRSQTTAATSVDPLIYVDGVRIYHHTVGTTAGARMQLSPMQDIAAEDVERIEVIKGASAATLYGTEAAGGVIQIFTKRGIAGAPVWNAEVTAGLNNQPPLNIGDNDPWELFTKCGKEMYAIGVTAATHGQELPFADPTCPSSGRWFRNAPVARYNLSVRGGGTTSTYFLSGSYSDENGTLQGQRARVGSVRANVDFEPIESVKIQFNNAVSIRDLDMSEDGNTFRGFLLNTGRGNSGNFKGGKGDECESVPAGVECVTNKYIFTDAKSSARSNRFTNGLTIQHDASDALRNRLTLGWDYSTIDSNRHMLWGSMTSALGELNVIQQHQTKFSFDYAGSWIQSFGTDLNSTFSWGGQIFRDYRRVLTETTRAFAGPGKPTLSSGSEWSTPGDSRVTQTNAGFFLQELLGYKDRLFFTLGMRVDGNSAFGDDFGLQKYPKASLAYVISDESFWPRDWWDAMKLRGAFGYSGKAPGPFDKVRTWNPISDDGTAGFSPGNVGNSELGPERTREVEVGFDASFLQGRLGVEATYYNAKTTDALVAVQLPESDGNWGSRMGNVGELMGEGLEFQLSASLYRSDLIEWRAQANLAFSRNEALDLDCEDVDGTEVCQQLSVGTATQIRVGYAVPTYFGYHILNPNEHAAPIRSDSLLPTGPVYPTRNYSFNTSISIGSHVTLDALLEHQGGHYLRNGTGYQNSRRGVWWPCYEVQKALAHAMSTGDESVLSGYTALERARCATNAMGAASAGNPTGHSFDYWQDKADFWKLRSVSVMFELPRAWVERYASRATLTLTGRNLFKWTDWVGTDPEMVDSSGYGTGAGSYGRFEYYLVPQARTFLATLRVTF